MMKHIVLTAAVLFACVGPVFGMPVPMQGSIEFVDSSSPGAWLYNGIDTFTFAQPITVSDVDGSGVDTLNGMFVHLPDMVVADYTVLNPGVAAANILPQGSIQIWDTPDQSGNMLMQADFINPVGSFFAYFAAGNLYAPDTPDLTVSAINNSIGSDVLDGMNIGAVLGLVLTLNHDNNFTDFMFQTPAVSTAGGLSGQINIIEGGCPIPEPATMILLGLGALELRKRR